MRVRARISTHGSRKRLTLGARSRTTHSRGVIAAQARAKPGKPIDLEKLEGKTFRVDRIKGDTLPDDVEEDLAFGIYLLGHDSVCDHKITFVKRRGRRTYDLRWRARVALTYVGNYNLKHSLEATLPGMRLDAIELSNLDGKAALALLPSVIARPRTWKLQRRKLVPIATRR